MEGHTYTGERCGGSVYGIYKDMTQCEMGDK